MKRGGGVGEREDRGRKRMVGLAVEEVGQRRGGAGREGNEPGQGC
jgi:hypothetical protein